MIPCFAHLENELEEVTSYISSNLSVSSPFVGELARHFLSTMGQRIRPSLVLELSRIGKGKPAANAPGLGAMVELVHSASLLHDDVIDKGRVRRNRLTVNAKWGNKEAVLLGDLLLSRSLMPLADEGDSRCIRSLFRITSSLSEGQLLELANFGNRDLDEEGYFRIIELKTAIFFAECCYIGAVASGASEPQLDQARQFGLEVGFAYQILDDLLDVTATVSTLGKDIQNDLLHGKMTLPFIFCLARNEGRDILDFPASQPPAAEAIASYVRRSGAYEYCVDRARKHSARAEVAASKLGDDGVRKTLSQFLGYLFRRVERFSAPPEAAERTADSPTAAA